MSRNPRAWLVIASSGLIGLLLGGGAIVAAQSGVGSAPSGSSSRALGDEEASAAPSGFERNDKGLTYGSYTVDGPKPDLVPVATDDGKPGYVYYTDLHWAPADSPEEAVALMEQRVNENGEIIVPVYLLDGETVIGAFTAGTVSTVAADDDEK